MPLGSVSFGCLRVDAPVKSVSATGASNCCPGRRPSQSGLYIWAPAQERTQCGRPTRWTEVLSAAHIENSSGVRLLRSLLVLSAHHPRRNTWKRPSPNAQQRPMCFVMCMPCELSAYRTCVRTFPFAFLVLHQGVSSRCFVLLQEAGVFTQESENTKCQRERSECWHGARYAPRMGQDGEPSASTEEGRFHPVYQRKCGLSNISHRLQRTSAALSADASCDLVDHESLWLIVCKRTDRCNLDESVPASLRGIVSVAKADGCERSHLWH